MKIKIKATRLPVQPKAREAKPCQLDEATRRSNAEPWVRLPKPRQRLLGLSRTTLLELCEGRKIRSAVLKKRYAIRGIRLLNMESLLDYLERSSRD